jgi:hypothetical protein
MAVGCRQMQAEPVRAMEVGFSTTSVDRTQAVSTLTIYCTRLQGQLLLIPQHVLRLRPAAARVAPLELLAPLLVTLI